MSSSLDQIKAAKYCPRVAAMLRYHVQNAPKSHVASMFDLCPWYYFNRVLHVVAIHVLAKFQHANAAVHALSC